MNMDGEVILLDVMVANEINRTHVDIIGKTLFSRTVVRFLVRCHHAPLVLLLLRAHTQMVLSMTVLYDWCLLSIES